MLAYAPRPTGRSASPRTLLFVAAGHAVAIALVLTARSDFVENGGFGHTEVVFVPTKPPPPPQPSDPAPPSAPSQSAIDTPPVIIPTPPLPADPIASGPPITAIDPVIGNAVEPQPAIFPDPPRPAIVRRAARFITPADLVRPPYPAAKQRLEEEASLRLSLGIDARGRVTSVSPVGAADPMFLDAARRHILRHWRYQPASEGGEAVASNVVITLTFRLEE
jgi:periplasmic protein TonB